MFFLKRKKRTEPTARCAMLVLAAGSSSRMGQDKITLEIDRVPVIVHTLRIFEALPEIDEVIVVTREDLIADIADLCKMFNLSKVSKVIRGGASRVESARLGTLEVKNSDLIGIHDGARPFASAEMVRAVILKAQQTGAAAPALPVKDTIKVARNGLVEYTPDRSTLFAVQTPQIFDASLIRAALQKALDDGTEITDDCSAVERLGMKVSLVEGDERNFKLTTPADIQYAESILGEIQL